MHYYKIIFSFFLILFSTNVFSQSTTVNTSICDGDSIYLQGAWQKSSGTFTDITSTGTIITNLTINPSPIITPNFIFNGTAIAQPGNVFQLTQALNNQAGSVWNNVMIDLNQPFTLDVDLFLGCSSGGADGIAFVLQPISTSLGSSGGGIGYQGISPSFAIEFDTWLNNLYSDPWYNHVSIQKNGNLNHTGPTSLTVPNGFPPTGFSSIEDCKWHNAIFNWDPLTTNFTLDFDGIQILNYNGDIISNIFNGNSNVFWGFTGSTGSASNLQRIRFNHDLSDTTICQNDSIIVNALTTSSSFSYNWYPNYNISNNTLASPLFFPDTTTKYTLDITNSFGCTHTDSFLIIVDTNSRVNFPTIPSLCIGDSAINLNISPTGGSLLGSGLVGVNNGFFDPNISQAGSYNLTYSINNLTTGCSDSKTQIIEVYDTPELTATTTNVSTCFGNDGSIDISVQGGTNPISYSWNNGMTTQDLNNIVAGYYSLTAVDNNGCSDTISAIITQPISPIISFSKLDASCYGANDASIDITVTGGLPPYSYFWSNSSTNQDLYNLVAGYYYLTVTDSNGCEVSQGIIIEQPSEIIVNHVTTDVRCFGENNGSALLNISGGKSPYVQNWNGFSSNNLSAGVYFYNVTDSTGCSKYGQISINEPSELEISPLIKSVSCHNGTDGSVSLNTSGGVPPYSYNWNGFNPTNLQTGIYSFTVTDFNNCTIEDSIFVAQPNPIQVSIIVNHTSCNGYNDGSANLNISGGTLPYVQNWGIHDNNNLSAGTYNFDVIDSNGCTYTDLITINEPTQISAVIDTFRASCYGYNDGYVLTSYSGGIPPYIENWGGFNPNNLVAGTYNFSVTDNNSCTNQFRAIITQPNDIFVSETISNVSCNGFDDGKVSLSISGGTFPYSIDWKNADINNLQAGIYTYTINDFNGCIKNSFISISEPDSLKVSENVSNVSCFNYNDGSIVLEINGGTKPYTQKWGGYNPNQLYSGLYDYEVVDRNGCSVSSVVFVDQADKIKASFSSISEICENDSIALEFEIENPSSNFYYAKVIDSDNNIYEFTIDSTGKTLHSEKSLTLFPTSTGNIIFEIISDEFGCQSGVFDTSFIKLKKKPIINMSIGNICSSSSSFALNQAYPSGGTYSVNDIQSITFNTEQLGIGSHTVNYFYQDPNTGCSNTIEEVVSVVQNPSGKISVSPSVTDSLNSDIYFSSSYRTGKDFYWYLDDNFIENNQSFWKKVDRVGDYDVKLIVVDNFGCSDTSFSSILVNPVFSVFIPNSFTPGNNDDVNNYFGPVTYSEASFIISIYNSWGQKIYESPEFWDGKVNDNFVPPGTYTYYIEVIDFKGKPVDFFGKLQIIR